MNEALDSRTQPATAGVGEPAMRPEHALDETGVDLTLVRSFLRLTPTERLLAVQNFMNALSTVRTPPRAGTE
jgi:hypothetical protein